MAMQVHWTLMYKQFMARPLLSLFSANDEKMMWRVRMEGDAQAFATLVARWEKPIQRLCARMTGDLHKAEDLAQMAFARVFAKREDWEPTGRFSTFLWRVALNLCHDELRRMQRRGESSLEALAEESGEELEDLCGQEASPAAQVELEERAGLVRRALLRLSPEYRQVVVLRHYEGLKFREIAEVLNIPEGTVKSRMAEALVQLNKLLTHVNEEKLCKRETQTPEVMAL
jgi:RNA polymerase sigma-70 factor (ECF subfamily)